MSNSKLFTYDNLVHAVAAATGSMIGMVVFYPFDTVRCRLQVDDRRKAENTFKIIGEIAQEEGIPSLYQGIVPVLQSICASNFVYFYVYRALKTTASAKEKNKDLILASIAGVINVIVTTPLWMVNTRMKVSGVARSYQYRGLLGTYVILPFLRVTTTFIYSVVSLAIFYCFALMGIQEVGNLWQTYYRGVCYEEIPPRYIKATELEEVSNTVKFRWVQIGDGMLKVIKHEGWKTLWAGTLPSLMLVSNPAIHMAVYQAIKRRFPEDNLGAVSFFVISAIAKMVATIATYPLQLVQTKLRHGHGQSDLPPNASALQLLLHVLKKNGILGLYKGMEAKLWQTVLTTALMFMTYEKIAIFVLKIMKAPKSK